MNMHCQYMRTYNYHSNYGFRLGVFISQDLKIYVKFL